MPEFSVGLLTGLLIVPLYKALLARWDSSPRTAPSHGTARPRTAGQRPDRQQQHTHETQNFLHYNGEEQEEYHGT